MSLSSEILCDPNGKLGDMQFGPFEIQQEHFYYANFLSLKSKQYRPKF